MNEHYDHYDIRASCDPCAGTSEFAVGDWADSGIEIVPCGCAIPEVAGIPCPTESTHATPAGTPWRA